MAITGFYGGYLQALQAMSGVESQQVQREQARQNMAIQQRAIQIDDQERSILSQVFKQQAIQQGEDGMIQANNDLSQQYMQAGQALMGINPKTGMKLLEDGGQLQTRNQQLQIGKIKTEAAKNELVGAIAGSVRDQVSLDASVDKLAKLGIAVPSKYRSWNEQSEMYYNSMENAAIPATQQAQLQARASELLIKERSEQIKADAADRAEKAKASQAVKNREKVAVREFSDVFGRGEKGLERETGELGDLGMEPGLIYGKNSWFKKLSPEAQKEAALKVRIKAQEYLKGQVRAGEEEDMELAMEEARTSVLDELNPNKKKEKTSDTGLPAGARQIGTSGGKPVYEDSTGKRYIVR